jgi:hypothetical protein
LILERRSETLFDLLDKEDKDQILGKCLGLIAENTYSSFYGVFEILKTFYGGEHRFIKMPGINKREDAVLRVERGGCVVGLVPQK